MSHIANNPPAPAGGELPESVCTAPRDADGFPIPTIWQHSPNWPKLHIDIRARWSRVWIEEEIKKDFEAKMAKAKEKPKRGPAPKFTTQYAVDWGKSQRSASGFSWRLIDRERFFRGTIKGRPGHHSDLMLGLDALFDDWTSGMVGIQAGTPGEEKAHARTFLERGGPATAARRQVRVYWLAFERGNKTPVEKAQWTEEYLRTRFPDLFESGPAPLLIL